MAEWAPPDMPMSCKGIAAIPAKPEICRQSELGPQLNDDGLRTRLHKMLLFANVLDAILRKLNREVDQSSRNRLDSVNWRNPTPPPRIPLVTVARFSTPFSFATSRILGLARATASLKLSSQLFNDSRISLLSF